MVTNKRLLAVVLSLSLVSASANAGGTAVYAASPAAASGITETDAFSVTETDAVSDFAGDEGSSELEFVFNQKSADKVVGGTLTYTVKKGTLTKVKMPAGTKTVSIPAGKKIKKIGANLFDSNHSIEMVVLPEGVTAIGANAFNDCTSLKTVVLPETLKSIGKYAFFECHRLKNITMPESLEKVGTGAFYACDKLENVAFSSHLTSLGEYAFASCSALSYTGFYVASDGTAPQLKTIPHQCFAYCPALSGTMLPDSVTTIGRRAFCGDEALSMVTMPSSLSSIGEKAFSGCGDLTTIEANTGGDDDYNYEDYDENYDYSDYNYDDGDYDDGGNTALTISAKTIGKNAFQNSQITSVILAEGVQTIEEGAFKGCYGLSEISPLPSTVQNVGTGVFEETGITEIAVSSANPYLTSVGGALYNKERTRLIAYPAGNTATSYAVPAGTTEIGDRAFCGALLESVTLPSGITTIGAEAFKQCPVANITFPQSLTTIKDGAFSSCSLTSVSIPNSVTTIGESAFSSSPTLESVTIGDGVTELPALCFGSCMELRSVSIGKNITKIDAQAFADCTEIGSFANMDFSGNTHFAVLDDGSLASADKTVYYCSPLFTPYGEDGDIDYECTVADGITEIAPYAFAGGSAAVKTIYLPKSVTKIGENAIGYSSMGTWTDKVAGAVLVSQSAAAKKYAAANDIAYFTDTPDFSDRTMKLKAGKSKNFKIQYAPSGTVYYTSGNPAVAKVSKSGKITAVGKGKTNVIATIGTKNIICRVTVTSGKKASGDGFPKLKGYTALTDKTTPAWENKYYAKNSELFHDEDAYPATRVYSSNDYVFIKSAILGKDSAYFARYIPSAFGEDYHQYEKIASNLSKEIRLSKLAQNTVFYSGTSDLSGITGGGASMAEMKGMIGKTVTFKNVTSTSIDHRVASGFSGGDDTAYSTVLEFYAPKNKTPGVYLSGISMYSTEQEFLLDKNVVFKVVDAGVREVNVAEYSEDYEDEIHLERYMKLLILR